MAVRLWGDNKKIKRLEGTREKCDNNYQERIKRRERYFI